MTVVFMGFLMGVVSSSSSTCVCSGGLPGLPGLQLPKGDARARAGYGARCGRWDSADEDPWCIVGSGACGEDTFQSDAGHYWSHRPCPVGGEDAAAEAAGSSAAAGGGGGGGAAAAAGAPRASAAAAPNCAAIGAELKLSVSASAASAHAARAAMERASDACAGLHTIWLDLSSAALVASSAAGGKGAAATAAAVRAGGAALDGFLAPRFEWSFAPWDYNRGGANGGGAGAAAPVMRGVRLTRKYPRSGELQYRRALALLQSPPAATAAASAAAAAAAAAAAGRGTTNNNTAAAAAAAAASACAAAGGPGTAVLSHPFRFFGSDTWAEMAQGPWPALLALGFRMQPATIKADWFTVSPTFCPKPAGGGGGGSGGSGGGGGGGPVDRWSCYYLPLTSCPLPAVYADAALRARACRAKAGGCDDECEEHCAAAAGGGNFMLVPRRPAAAVAAPALELAAWSGSWNGEVVPRQAGAARKAQALLRQATAAIQASGGLGDGEAWAGGLRSLLVTRPNFKARAAWRARQELFLSRLDDAAAAAAAAKEGGGGGGGMMVGRGRAHFVRALRSGNCVAVHLRRGDKLEAEYGVGDPREQQIKSFLRMQKEWLAQARLGLARLGGAAAAAGAGGEEEEVLDTVFLATDDPNYVARELRSGRMGPTEGLNIVSLEGHDQTSDPFHKIKSATADVFDLWSTFDFGARCKVLVGNRHSTFTQLMLARACYVGGACPVFANFADPNSLFS